MLCIGSMDMNPPMRMEYRIPGLLEGGWMLRSWSTAWMGGVTFSGFTFTYREKRREERGGEEMRRDMKKRRDKKRQAKERVPIETGSRTSFPEPLTAGFITKHLHLLLT